MMLLPPILEFARHLLAQRLRPGDRAVDGTAGNGHDTLLLAECVGSSGCVYAFDIQAEALAATEARLQQSAAGSGHVRLVHAGHERMAEFVPAGIAAAVFNFGYLPGGDKRITTAAESSLKAVQAALSLLDEGGLLVMVLYHGHEAGKAEMRLLTDWAAALPQRRYRVLRYEFANQKNCPPVLLAVEKLPV